MFKSITAALLVAFGNAQAQQVGVPPHSHNCATATGATRAAGLVRDYDMGGCKCADDTAEWGPGPGLTEVWSCYCAMPDMYQSIDNAVVASDANNRSCGVILECQTQAVLQQKNQWTQEMQRLKKESDQVKNLNRKQLVKDNELNSVRHLRKQRSKENRMRARVALQIVAKEYKAVKMAFVSGSISKETMAKAHNASASSVASIRDQWRQRQQQIDAFYENAIARTITMENFVDQDQQKVDQYFIDRAADLKKRYGERIQAFMMMPIVNNLYKAHDLNSNNLPDVTTKRKQNDSAVCPLWQ